MYFNFHLYFIFKFNSGKLISPKEAITINLWKSDFVWNGLRQGGSLKVCQGHISLTERPRIFGPDKIGELSGRNTFPITSSHLRMFFVPNRLLKKGWDQGCHFPPKSTLGGFFFGKGKIMFEVEFWELQLLTSAVHTEYLQWISKARNKLVLIQY